jgi:hypothetical protein
MVYFLKNPPYLESLLELVTLCQSLILILPEISAIISTEGYKDLKMMNALLTDELEKRREDGDVHYKQLGFQSRAEERMYNIVTKVCRNTDIEIQANIHLFDLFESDIILRIPSNDGREETIINIEVDGIRHKLEKTITFCERKDKHLKLKGVYVSRIDTTLMDAMNNIELEEWVSRVISHASSSTSTSTSTSASTSANTTASASASTSASTTASASVSTSASANVDTIKQISGEFLEHKNETIYDSISDPSTRNLYEIISHATLDLAKTTLKDETKNIFSPILDNINHNLSDNQPTGNLNKSDQSIPKLPSKLKRFISDEQKIINNARARERRRIKSADSNQKKEL